ncbi:hypothetical protein X805_27360 [Sphaerotilus natans subsp. natans DSM 6575]|uniref:Uncharacterized protein n=1 Tax=Sphaerotilus natans subsp. natans DSM 6575 TaxID=1286631 RepID=A0A059KKG5_9BURK|nr:hypothetical protein X805_27360 [Sphaerotilus natans subsp. natans DSM 6575]
MNQVLEINPFAMPDISATPGVSQQHCPLRHRLNAIDPADAC